MTVPLLVFYTQSIYTAHMNPKDIEDIIIQKDSNGNILTHGDSIILIKDLDTKENSLVIKQGSKAKIFG